MSQLITMLDDSKTERIKQRDGKQRTRTFDKSKRTERYTWQTERSKKSTAHRTTSSIKKVNNKGDECSRRERKWQNVSSGTKERNEEAIEGRYKIIVKGTIRQHD
jgi:hypothetical protein